MIANAPGQRLYSEIAKALPIIDYHCHLDARAIWENKPFTDITQLWLEGDHYKWRAMRANGISEQKITGNASAEEKFAAWAQTVEASFGNPLYHWTHLELKHYFAIDETLNSKNWSDIMAQCNTQLRHDDFLPQALIRRSNVEALIADLKKAKPATSKGVYIKKITLSSTMGPGLTVDVQNVSN